MRKQILTMALLLLMSLTTCTNTYANYGPGDPNADKVTESVTSTTPVSDYMKTVYKASDNDKYDELSINALKLYEENKNSDQKLTVFTGTKEECNNFLQYFNYCFSYTKEIRLSLFRVVNTDKYFCAFEETANSNDNLIAYLAEVKKAQALAVSLAGANQDETINNIRQWMKTNISYNHDVKNADVDTVISAYYGIYDKKPVICAGYAMGTYQLCRMNGITSSIVLSINTKNNVGHAATNVTINGHTKYLDTCFDIYVDQIPENFSVDFISSSIQ